ncbi:MAG: amidohydrolase [Bacteroidales bacterium]|jgi:predicted amidohydrolase|nr:amidohydrolase [Bacteroidales bacterium]
MMKISIIQSDINWENKSLNFRKYERIISKLNNPDIIILPEMFSTGFTASSESLGEPPRGITFDWMMHISEKSNSAVCGSYIIKIKTNTFNRWVFVAPDKRSWHYDKRHLFKMNNVETCFTPGTNRLIFKFRGFRICPNICYDLRFPVWSRNKNDYDLLINSANWPRARRDVWITLLKARAIENLCFVAGANRTGTDGAGIKYSGDSMIIDPKGEVMASAGRNKESVIAADLSLSELNEFRIKFPAHLDADKFILGL